MNRERSHSHTDDDNKRNDKSKNYHAFYVFFFKRKSRLFSFRLRLKVFNRQTCKITRLECVVQLTEHLAFIALCISAYLCNSLQSSDLTSLAIPSRMRGKIGQSVSSNKYSASHSANFGLLNTLNRFLRTIAIRTDTYKRIRTYTNRQTL